MIFGFRRCLKRVLPASRRGVAAFARSPRKNGRALCGCHHPRSHLVIVALTVLDSVDPSTADPCGVQFPLAVLTSSRCFQIGRIFARLRDPTKGHRRRRWADQRLHPMRESVRSAGLGAIAVSIAAPVLFAFGLPRPVRADFASLRHGTACRCGAWVMALQLVFGRCVRRDINRQGPAARRSLDAVALRVDPCCMLARLRWRLVLGGSGRRLKEFGPQFGRGFTVGERPYRAIRNLLAFAIDFRHRLSADAFAQGTLRSNVLPKTKI